MVFATALVLTLAAKGAALFPLFYSIDAYIEIQSPSYHADNYMQRLSQGRFGHALLNEALTALGISSPLTNTLYSLLCMIAFIWVGLIVCRLWQVSNDLPLSLLVTAFIALHPYQAELFTFVSTPVYTSGALIFAFSALYFSRGTASRVVWTALCFTLALSLYQTTLNYVAVTLAFAVLLELARDRRPSGDGGRWRHVAEQTGLWPRLATLSLGLAIYLVANKAMQHIFDVTPVTRARFISWSEVPLRLDQAQDAVVRMLFLREPVLPASVKVVLSFIGLMALCLAVRSCWSPERRLWTRLSIASLLLLLVSAAAACVIGVTLLTQSWWPMPRILSALSFFQAGLVALALSLSGPKLRIVLTTMASIAVFAFIGINNRIFTDQLRVNLRDLSKANRIVAALESHPSFAQIQRVAVVGGDYAYRSPIDTMQGDLNISAFYAAWSKVPILNEVSGYSFGVARPDEQALATQHCAQTPKWPAAGSITVAGSLAIVCQ